MCSDNPNMPKEVNKAKCFVISCFVFSIFSMMGFASGTPGVIGGVCGLLACFGSSILMCCAPTRIEEGNCKFTAASVLLLIAGIIQLVMGVLVVVGLVAVLSAINAVDDDGDRSGKDAVSGGIAILGGVAAFFIFTAGILNILGGVYCCKAGAAIQAMLSRGSPSDDPSWQAPGVPYNPPVQPGMMLAPANPSVQPGMMLAPAKQ